MPPKTKNSAQKRKEPEKSTEVSTPKQQKKKNKKETTPSTTHSSTPLAVAQASVASITSTEVSTPKQQKKETSATSRDAQSSVTSSSEVPQASSSSNGATIGPNPKIPAKDRATWELTTLNRSIDQIFESCYSIPIYQRPYAWEVNDILDLFTDIYSEYTNNSAQSSYFIGSIVLKAGSERQEVIDGQQRITSLSIIFSALRQLLSTKAESKKKRKAIYKYYLKIHKGTLTDQYRLDIRNDGGGLFFKEYVVEDDGHAKLLKLAGKESLKKSEIDDIIKKLDELGKLNSTSAYNCARNYFHIFLKIKKLLKTDAEILDFIHFLSYNCAMIAITVPQQANELSIFGTLNLRGKDLSPMDKLKLDFGNLFTCQNSEKYDKIVDQWNNMYQDIGEDFPNILETIYQLIHPTKNINVNTRDYKNILNEIAENLKSNLEDVELVGEIFLNNYMNPIYIGHKSLKDVKTRPSFSENADNDLINKMISRAVFIGEKCPKGQKIGSEVILSVLIGICHCKAEGKKFLNYDVSSIPLATIRKLIAVWCHHVLLTFLMGEVNVKFSHMLKEISELLKGDNMFNFSALKVLLTNYAKKWMEKMKRQMNQFKNSETDKKKCSDLKRVFNTILPIINDYMNKKVKKTMSVRPKYSLCSVLPLKKQMGNKFYQIGNFTLGKSISDDTNNEERLEQFKKNKLKINSQFVNLTKLEEFTESMCEKRTEELLRIIKEIIKEIEQFEDEEQ